MSHNPLPGFMKRDSSSPTVCKCPPSNVDESNDLSQLNYYIGCAHGTDSLIQLISRFTCGHPQHIFPVLNENDQQVCPGTPLIARFFKRAEPGQIVPSSRWTDTVRAAAARAEILIPAGYVGHVAQSSAASQPSALKQTA